jgi:hypothetical protein
MAPIVGTVTYVSQLDQIRPNRARCVPLRPAPGVDGLAVAQGATVPEVQRVRFRGQYTGTAYQAKLSRDAVLEQIGTTVAIRDCHGEERSCFILDATCDYAEAVQTGTFALSTTYDLIVVDA